MKLILKYTKNVRKKKINKKIVKSLFINEIELDF